MYRKAKTLPNPEYAFAYSGSMAIACWKYCAACSKLVLPNVVDGQTFRIFSIVAQSPDGAQITRGLSLEAYLGIVAATNFKQRTRKMLG